MRKIILGTVLGLVFSIGAYSVVEASNRSCDANGQCGVWVEDRTTYDRICLVLGWISCGEWTIYDANGAVLNTVVGPAPLSAFIAYVRCQTAYINLCGDSSSVPLGFAVQTGTHPSLVFVPDIPPTPLSLPTAGSTQPAWQPEATPVPQPTQSVPQPEATSVPQPTAQPTQSAPQPTATAAPPVVGQPTPTSIPPVVVEPTQTPEPVVPRIVPTVDPNVIPNTYEWKLSDNNGEFRWQPKRRSYFSGEQQAI